MNCKDRIISEDIYDYILEDIPGIMEDIKENAYGCAERINSQWIIAHGELPIERKLNISSLGYYTIPKLFGLMQNDEFEPDTTAVDEIEHVESAKDIIANDIEHYIDKFCK